MLQYNDGPDDPDAILKDFNEKRPDDSLMVDDIIRLIKDANGKEPTLCQSANDPKIVRLYLEWINMEMHYWTPFLAQFIGKKGIKPGKTKAFAIFATTYLGQLFEGPIRHHLLTLGYLGGIVQGTEGEPFFEKYIWHDPEKKRAFKELSNVLDQAVCNLKGYSAIHSRISVWRETGLKEPDKEEFGAPRVRNQIQHAHWYLDIKGDSGAIVFPFLGPQPESGRDLDIQQWIGNWRDFLEVASSMSVGVYVGYKKA